MGNVYPQNVGNEGKQVFGVFENIKHSDFFIQIKKRIDIQLV